MGRDVTGLVTLDFILWVVFRSVMSVALVVEVAGVDADDRPRHPPRFGIPAHVLADFELRGHPANISFVA